VNKYQRSLTSSSTLCVRARVPTGVVGRNVRDCHPQQSLHKVETILSERESGTRDTARFWIDLNMEDTEEPQKILI
jgi:DUF438 domain-containing protein